MPSKRGGLAPIKDYPLSDSDIRKILGRDIKIITYPDLNSYTSIDQAFDSKGRCIMLYLTENESTGHWVCMLNKPSGIEFFDPYGEPPEMPLRMLPEEQRESLGENDGTLTALLRASGRPVFYNTYPFQTDRADVNTCGRHSVVRCLYAPDSLKKYKKIMDTSGFSPDDFVSALTAQKLGK
jgi:hypothetical protein